MSLKNKCIKIIRQPYQSHRSSVKPKEPIQEITSSPPQNIKQEPNTYKINDRVPTSSLHTLKNKQRSKTLMQKLNDPIRVTPKNVLHVGALAGTVAAAAYLRKKLRTRKNKKKNQ